MTTATVQKETERTPSMFASLLVLDVMVAVAVTNGRLDSGPWEQIFYGEFDGGRRKRVLVKIIGE